MRAARWVAVVMGVWASAACGGVTVSSLPDTSAVTSADSGVVADVGADGLVGASTDTVTLADSSGDTRVITDTLTDVAEDLDRDTAPGVDFPWITPVDLSALDPSACALPEPVDLFGFDPAYVLPVGDDWIANKTFPLLVMLTELPDAAAALRADSAVQDLGAARRASLAEAVSCEGEELCVRAALVDGFGTPDLPALWQALGAGDSAFVSAQMRPSGWFERYVDMPDEGVFGDAWREQADGLVHAFGSFGGELTAEQRAAVVAEVDGAMADDVLFFEPLLEVTLGFMHAAGRDEAARYEPMDEGENAAALARLATLDWGDWPFAAILVPGLGPRDLDTPLTEAGELRCQLGAERLRAGIAPFIITSGGHVHPDRTPYGEAIEMKRYLMETLGVAEDHILVEPHARHTTTNLRDGARLLLRHGFPPDKPLLTTTDSFQSAYIWGLANRCRRELGYVPWRSNEILTIYDNCVLVDPTSLHVAPSDPLDP